MRAVIPVRTAGRRMRSGALSSTRRSFLCFSWIKNPAEEEPPVPVLLLQDMELCYRLLRRLVPGLQPGRAVSRLEILQHVIDYILELQTELHGEHREHRDRPHSEHRTGTCQETGG